MKLKQILIALFLLVSSAIYAQAQEEYLLIQSYNKYPKQAIKDADSMYQQAVKEDNHEMLIKSLILKTAFTLKINEDEYPRMIKELEVYIAKNTNIQIKSILHSYVGQLYGIYYDKNRSKIDKRSELEGYIPDDINAWSSDLFFNKINEHLLASIVPKVSLQQTPISDFNNILIIRNSSQKLRPTLYDFLCHRAIEMFSDLGFGLVLENGAPDNIPEILSPINTFLTCDIPNTQLSLNANALRVWQELLGFRQQKSNSNVDALLIADLGRLEDAHEMSSLPNKDSLYLQALALMQKKYIGNPMVVEIMAKKAQILINSHYMNWRHAPNKDEADDRKRALVSCEIGIQQYPDYPRIDILKEIIEEIKDPKIRIELPLHIYPKDKLLIKINYQSIKSANISIYQIHENILDYKKGSDMSKTLVHQSNPTLAYDFIYQDTLIPIKILKPGLYEVIVKFKNRYDYEEEYEETDEDIDNDDDKYGYDEISETFICSELFTTQQTTNRQTNFQTCDWQSGEPIKDAKILIYTSYKYKLIDSVYTNEQGLAVYHPTSSSDNYYYQAVNSNNPNHNISRIYGLNNLKKDTSVKFNDQVSIITDRKIYRPGQTVLFKGLAWRETLNSEEILPNKSYEIIFRDPNHKEIAKQQVTTNQLGSFTGSFVIPQQILNGGFRILTNGKINAWIQVADYTRPEFEITFSKAKRIYYTGDSVYIKGNVKSFSGININNTTVKYEISNSLFRSYRKPQTVQGVTQTDENGNFEFSFKAGSNKNVSRMNSCFFYGYKVNAKVTDSKGETQENDINIPVYTRDVRAIIDIPEQMNKKGVTAFHISLNNLPNPTESRTVKYTLAKLLTPKIITQTLDTIIEKTVLSGELKIKTNDSIQPSLNRLASGRYLFTVVCDNIKSEKIFYLYSPTDKRPPIPTYKWLVKEKTKCKPGETARVQFGTSVKEAYLIYEIYTPEKLLERKFIKLSNKVINIEIPYLAEYGHKIWLDIKYVKDKHYINEIIPIEYIYENKTLDIQTTVFRDKLLPGQEEEWKLKVLTVNKNPAMTEVLAMMYDASLDKLDKYNPHYASLHAYRRYIYPYKWEKADLRRNRADFTRFHNKIDYYDLWFDRLNIFSSNVDLRRRLVGFLSEPALQRTGTIDYASLNAASNATANKGASEIELRKNFQETAFFYPQLQTDSTGTVTFKFKVPDALTKWKFIAIAHTPEMGIGQIERYITTSKPLMVRPNLPRFFRSGDQSDLKVTVSNLSDTIQKGIATIEFLTANSKQVIHKQQQHFNVAAKQNQTVDFNFVVPENMEFTVCQITATSGNFSDGEQHLIPILPDETLITETLPIYMTSAGEQTYFFNKDNSLKENYRLTFELTSNPIWYAVLALPNLAEPTHDNVTEIAASYYVNSIAANIARSNPRIIEAIRNWNISKDDVSLSSKLEQNSELKSILLEASPWVMQAQNESERMQSLIQLFDKNRLKYLQTQALKKLADLQTTSGGWSWFKGMRPSHFMTSNVLTMLYKTNSITQIQYGEQEKTMQIKALSYLDNQIKKDFEIHKQRGYGYGTIIYLHTRSLYRDIPLGDALDAHKYYMSLIFKGWNNFSPYEKALIAIVMKNYGFIKEAKDVLKSIRQYAIIDPAKGMYWPNNKNTYYRNSAVLKHTAIMEAFQEIEGNSQDLNLMKQWLLRQKQVQTWGSVPATVSAIHALLLTGDDQLSSTTPIGVKIGKHIFETDTDKNPLGYIKKSYQAESIEPNMLSTEITKEANTPSWGGMYLQYFEKLDQVKDQKTDISVNKELFIANIGTNGKQELTSIDKQELKIGSKVVIRLTLSLKSDMEFLHLKDLRAACFETIEQLSGIHWKFGSVYYQDVKDAATNFFFNALSRGTYVIEYPVWVNQSGTYQDGIATFQSIYSPEFNAFSSAQKIQIK